MSKDITIQQKGVPTDYLGIVEINTKDLKYGGTFWIEEMDTTLQDITIYANGTYSPSDYGCYGFNLVNVKVPTDNSVVVKDVQTSVLYRVYPDRNGNLIKVVIQ